MNCISSGMQCFLIFDHLNDVIYVKGNSKFDRFLREHCVREGLLKKEDEFAWPDALEYHNALLQFFSPVIASQRLMTNQFNSPYTAIKCEKGTLMVFSDYLGYVLAAIGDEERISESFLQRKLKVFRYLANFLCGPSFDILKVTPGETNEKRIFLGRLLDTWDFLYHNDLSFLLEAHERLLTNVDLSSNWVKLLQNVLEKVRGGLHDVTACHAFVLIKTKILALYSRNVGVISEGDILLLIVLASTHYADLLPVNREKESRQGSLQSSDSDQYFSPSSSPLRTSSSSEQFGVPSADLAKEISDIVIEGGTFETTRPNQSGIPTDFEAAEGFVDITADFNCDLVFLQTLVSAMAPYLIYTVHITPGVALVVVSMVNKHALSGSLAVGIEVLNGIQNMKLSQSAKVTVDSLDSSMRSITESLRKQKLATCEVEPYLKRLQASWESTKKSGFLEFLKAKDPKILPARLDRALMELIGCLKQCFHKFCIGWYQKDTEVNGSLIDAQAVVRFSLADYVDYLLVKAQRNISMAAYYSDFPGMIHFVFVDRIANQITVPSMDFGEISADFPSLGSKHESLIWRKLYDMVEKAWSHLQMGHTSIVWRDDCFHYSYFIWFEDAMGNPQRPDAPCFSFDGFPLPGVVCGNFFKQFSQACFPSNRDFIRCYELFVIHLTTVPPSLVNQHARRLTATIWEVSGAAQSPLDLLL